jgi:hypothetical protein
MITIATMVRVKEMAKTHLTIPGVSPWRASIVDLTIGLPVLSSLIQDLYSVALNPRGAPLSSNLIAMRPESSRSVVMAGRIQGLVIDHENAMAK